ncbi:armadillo repeat-containing protein 5 [Prorops nasuta]|uniref:armadillo repeat-containing protein 5 n=1 Tax=Prorops nasuta TaxID=863751 RepID=UPI0034D001BF
MSSKDTRSGCQRFSELRKHVKSDFKPGIISCLTSIKNDSKWHKVAEPKDFLVLIDLLKCQTFKITNLTLSITADLCRWADIRIKLRETEIGINALWILKKWKSTNVSQNLHCRAYRLIGNLMKCEFHANSMCNLGATQFLATALQEKTDVATLLMALRAARTLWSMCEKSRKKILDVDIIKNVTGLLVMATEKVGSGDQKYSKLVEACLKAMRAFLVTLDPRCGHQMRGDNDTQGYKVIVEYCGKNDKMAIECLYNLTQIAECRPILGNYNAVKNLINLITQHSIMSKEVITSLCSFCREAVNRAKVREDNGLETILTLLKDDGCKQYHPLLLHALTQFVYDDVGIDIMVNNGLLEVLISKLKKMVAEITDGEEDINSTRKRRHNSSPDRTKEIKYNKIGLSRFSSDYPGDWSPDSTASVSFSPPSTPRNFSFDDNAEDNYSPVCSEEEPQEEEESLKSSKSITLDADDSQDSAKSHKPYIKEIQKNENIWTITLLSRLSYSNNPIEKLADPATIIPLVTYVKYSKNQKASRILTRIVRNTAYLIPLVKMGFVFEAQTLHGSEHYIRQLCALAETGGAVGELSTILLRGRECQKLIIAVSIPFLIKSRYLLKSLLSSYGGLRLIFHILEYRDHILLKFAVWSICRLANTLQIMPDKVYKYQVNDNTRIYCDNNYENLPRPATVTFVLDDGTTVDACRKTLCQKSEVFLAMLEGDFSESGKRRIKLKDASQEGLNTLLLAINGYSFENENIESLLDAVLLADKFLMPDVSNILTESSISKLNHKNFSRAWSWARNNSCDEFKSCCIKTFLTLAMSQMERVQAFCDFANGEYLNEFLDETKEIINKALCR